MRRNALKINKLLSARLAASLVALLGCTVWQTAHALGLGKLTLNSALGQPLAAEIDVSLDPTDTLESVRVRIADSALYRQQGLDYQSVLTRLSLRLDPRDGRSPVVRVTSSGPIQDPYIDLLIEINSATGRVVREYVFLLDPPGSATPQSIEPNGAPQPIVLPGSAASTAAPPPVSAEPASVTVAPVTSAPAGAAPASSVAATAPTPAQASSRAAGSLVFDGEVKVKAGDSLSAIADRNARSGVSIEQMMVAIFRANPDAFVGSNMNNLRKGVTLTIPSEAAGTYDAQSAKQEVAAATTNWRGYRDRIAAQAPTIEGQRGSSVASGQVAARVSGDAPAARAGDKLKLTEGKRASTQARAESSAANTKALADAQSRVKDLEKSVADLQKALELKNQALADIQKSAAAKAAPTPAAKVEAPKAPEPAPVAKASPPAIAPVPAPVPAPAPAVAVVAPKPEPAKETKEPVKAEPPKAEPAKEPPKEPVKVAPPVAAVTPASPPAGSADAKPAAPPTPPVAAVAPKPGATPPPEPAWYESILGFLSEPAVAGGLGLTALAGGGALWWLRRRRMQGDNGPATDMGGSVDTSGIDTVFGSSGAGLQSRASPSAVSAAPLTTSQFSRSGMGTIDTGEVDPIAEAEVYIAYGRESQAEEILVEALRTSPNRPELRQKLLEVYGLTGQSDAFERELQTLKKIYADKPERWKEVVALAQRFKPEHSILKMPTKADHEPVRVASPAGSPPAAPSNGGLAIGAVGAVGAAGAVAAGAAASLGATVNSGLSAATGVVSSTSANLSGTVIGETKRPIQNATSAATSALLREGQPPSSAAIIKNDDVGLDFSLDDSLRVPTLRRPAAVEQSFQTLASNTVAKTGTPVSIKPKAENPLERELAELESGLTNAMKSGQMPDARFVAYDNSTIVTGGAKGLSSSLKASALDLSLGDKARDGPATKSGSAGWGDAATKLELAKAYEDMGDKDGAKEILLEVLREGNDQQKASAQALLGKLA